MLPGGFFCLSTKFQLDLTGTTSPDTVRPKKARIARSAMKSASKTTPTFKLFQAQITPVLSTFVASSGWLWSNTHNIIQNGAEKADETRLPRVPKIRSCVLLKSAAKSVTQKRVVNEWSGCRALTGKMLVFWWSGRLQEVVANKGYCRGIVCWIWLASDLRPTSQTT